MTLADIILMSYVTSTPKSAMEIAKEMDYKNPKSIDTACSKLYNNGLVKITKVKLERSKKPVHHYYI